MDTPSTAPTPPQNPTERVRGLIAQSAQAEPPFTSLGTPYVGQDEFTLEIIRLGADAVAPLIELLPDAAPHAAASAAYCLGQLGDARAVPALQAALERAAAKGVKDEYDYAFIGNARAALSLLTTLPDARELYYEEG